MKTNLHIQNLNWRNKVVVGGAVSFLCSHFMDKNTEA